VTLLREFRREIAERMQVEAAPQKQQQMLLVTEKMASLGRLMVGIAHEMNTLWMVTGKHTGQHLMSRGTGLRPSAF
jgi:C4-dicarboxylate-specific signal transduction histidine kinase